MAAAASEAERAAGGADSGPAPEGSACLVCVSAGGAGSLEGALEEARAAVAAGATAVELRLDLLSAPELRRLVGAPEAASGAEGGGLDAGPSAVAAEAGEAPADVALGTLQGLIADCRTAGDGTAPVDGGAEGGGAPPPARGGGVQVVCTARAPWEGGSWPAEGFSEAERLGLLQRCALAGTDFVDVELRAAADFRAAGGLPEEASGNGCRLILSSHDFEGCPAQQRDLERLVERCWAEGADVPKVAVTAQCASEALRVLALHHLPSNAGRPIVALAMGEAGVASRLLAAKHGALLTFAAGPGGASAPGQPPIEEALGLYRLGGMSRATRAFGVIGDPIAHSKSPLVHNAALAVAGLDGCYVPLLVKDFPAFYEAAERLWEDGPGGGGALNGGFSGFSVTLPHKAAALAAAARADPVAASIGAANTLVRGRMTSLEEDGGGGGGGGGGGSGLEAPLPGDWAGNTDWGAALGAVERAAGGAGSLRGKRAVIVGAGGAGRALAFGARELGCEVVVANRDPGSAESLAQAVGGTSVPLALLQREENSGRDFVEGDLLLNSTSVGMQPRVSETPASREALRGGGFSLVFDAVYTPVETRLLREAQELGCVTVSGLEMFVGQAEEQFLHFTGQEPPTGVMREVLVSTLPPPEEPRAATAGGGGAGEAGGEGDRDRAATS